jgi:hypothetical protein
VKFDDATERTRLSGTITLGTPVADLAGAFAVEAAGASPDRRLLIAASGVTGFVGKGRDTTTTTDDVGVSFSNGSLLAVINADGKYAFDASGTAGLVGIDAITLTGTLVAQKNTTGSAVSENLTIGGTTKTLTVAKDVSKVSGTLTLSTENSLYLTGTIGVEKKTASLKLEDGTTVNTTAVQLGGTGISGFVGLNATPGHTDQTGVSLSNLSFGYTLASPTNSDAGKDLRTWSALKAAASSASLVGVDVVTATVSSLHLNLNRAGGTKDGTAATKTADFASSPLANTVGGQSSTLDFVGSILQAFALIEFSVSGFASIRGRFGIDLGNMDVKLPSFPDVDLPTSFLRMWGIDVDVSVGINGPSWSSPDFTGFDLRDVDFNLQINTRNPFTGLLPQLGSMKWFTLEASIPELTFAPFLDIMAPNIDLSIPKLSLNLTFDVPSGIDPIPYIDYSLSLPSVTLPALPAMPNFPGLPDLPALPSITGFSFNVPPVELLQIGNIPSLNLFNFLSLTGSLTFKRARIHRGTAGRKHGRNLGSRPQFGQRRLLRRRERSGHQYGGHRSLRQWRQRRDGSSDPERLHRQTALGCRYWQWQQCVARRIAGAHVQCHGYRHRTQQTTRYHDRRCCQYVHCQLCRCSALGQDVGRLDRLDQPPFQQWRHSCVSPPMPPSAWPISSG